MNQLAAFADTITLAEERGMLELPSSTVGLAHIRGMYREASVSDFSDAKLGRWLGWAQCAVVARGVATLGEMKQINLSRS